MKSPLRTLLLLGCGPRAEAATGAVPRQQGEVLQSPGSGLAVRGPQRSRSPVDILGLESSREAPGANRAGPCAEHGHPGPTARPGTELGEGGGASQFSLHQRSRGGNRSRSPALHGHGRVPIKRGECNVRNSANALGQRSLQAYWHTSAAGKAGTPASGQAAGGELPGHIVLPVGTAVAALSEPTGLGRPAGEAGSEGTQLHIRENLSSCSLPVAKLKNSSNYCYVNSTAQALYWIGEMSNDSSSAYGGAARSFATLSKSGQADIAASLLWRRLLSQWPNPLQQHDAGEFLRHVLTLLQPGAYQGCWQARLSNPAHTVDSGPLTMPVLLHIAGQTLPDLFANWHMQYAVHALQAHRGILICRIVRFDFSNQGAAKNLSPVFIRPGESIAVPVFEGPAGVSVQHEAFQVVFQIFHVGPHVHTGHYQCALSVPQTHGSQTRWHVQICDDNKAPRRAKPSDLQTIAHNVYLVGIVRSN